MISLPFGHTEHLSVFAGTALRLGLSAVLLLSASGKIWDMPGTRQAVSEFGVAPPQADKAAKMLIGAELGIAALLLLDFTVRLGALLGALLFLVFTLGVIRVLKQGRKPDCHCFGQLHSAPVGPQVVLRNSLLVAGSLYLVKSPGASLTFSPLSTLATYLGATCVGLAGSHLAMWKSFQSKVPSLFKPGQLVPHLELKAKDGSKVALHDVVRSSEANLLVFSSPNCGACKQIKPDLEQWKAALEERVKFLILDVEVEDDSEEWADGTWRIKRTALANFKISGTPGALLLDHQGRVLSSKPATGSEEIMALLRAHLS